MTESAATNYEEAGARVCQRCGVRGEGKHATPGDRHCRGCGCVDALRGMIAKLEFRLERTAAKDRAQPTHQERRGGLRTRSDTRFVLLDGERIALAEAARRLGLSTGALHCRLVNRTHDPAYRDVDVRAVGADVGKRGAGGAAGVGGREPTGGRRWTSFMN